MDIPTHVSSPGRDGSRLLVIDADTGERIEQVIEADAIAGTVTRYAVEDGHLVREGDRFKTVTEHRSIRFEVDEPAKPDQPAEGTSADQVGAQEQA